MKIQISDNLKDTLESISFFLIFSMFVYLIGELAITFDLATLLNLPELFKLKDDSNILQVFLYGFLYIILLIFLGFGMYLIYTMYIYLKNNISIKKEN